MTTIDENGNPINGEDGYSCVSYEYDANGYTTREFRTDVEGNGVPDGNGRAGYERVFDADGHILVDRMLGSDGTPVENNVGYAEIRRKYKNKYLVKEEYLDAEGKLVNRVDGYSTVLWEPGDNCTSVKFYDMEGNQIDINGLNLGTDIKYDSDGWSEWFTPDHYQTNSTVNIGYTNLGEKVEGDIYTCQVEVEFKGVTGIDGKLFRFIAQGAQDGKWVYGNVWNSDLCNLYDIPKDGIYTFTSRAKVTDTMVDVSTFDIGLRCDNWASGSYRVRKVKIEKGETAGEWSPGM